MPPPLLCLALLQSPPGPEGIPIDSVLVIERVGVGRRAPVFTDALEAARVRGEWNAPAAGDVIELPDGEKLTWRELAAGEDGRLRDPALRGGYAFWTYEAPEERVLLLDARGHRQVIVNGEPRGGDLYDLGITRLPVHLKQGTNELLFKAGRGSLAAKLVEPPGERFFEPRDATLPDVIRGEQGELLAGVIVTNASVDWATGLRVSASTDGGPATLSPVPDLLPCSSRKVLVRFTVPAGSEGEVVELGLGLIDAAGESVHEARLELAVKDPSEGHKRTFASEIDGSVQYYAVTPAQATGDGEQPPALILTLHGASVEATNQARAYGAKDWAHIVAPTNRRPYGFDWEDWGRLDALEVLELAEERYGTDPGRTYLTGHSMGGHGTWNLGGHFPDRFAAIAPSAGWRDFWFYSVGEEGEEPTPVEAMLRRAANGSRTLLLERNYLHGGVYVLHGDRDDNVPVTEARAMRERLAAFHPNWAYYERPGAGHWWGNECVDWPPLMDFLRQNELPAAADVLRVEFDTVSPGISSRCHWVTVLAQERPMEPSHVEVELDPAERRIDLVTDNVSRLVLDLGPFVEAEVLPSGEPLTLASGDDVLTELDWPLGRKLLLGRGREGEWTAGGPLAPWYKGPHRAGPFKDAFRGRMVFVFGTAGTSEETTWARAKARYDAEVFAYRGNGSVEIVPDHHFDPGADRDRNVILYGNADTNGAWDRVVPGNAIRVHHDHVQVGERRIEGEDLACLFVYPRKGSDVASVGVVAGTGLVGSRLTEQLPYFVSGVGYPDWVVIGAEMLSEGMGGVRGAGFFRDDWSSLTDDQAWREE